MLSSVVPGIAQEELSQVKAREEGKAAHVMVEKQSFFEAQKAAQQEAEKLGHAKYATLLPPVDICLPYLNCCSAIPLLARLDHVCDDLPPI